IIPQSDCLSRIPAARSLGQVGGQVVADDLIGQQKPIRRRRGARRGFGLALPAPRLHRRGMGFSA
ncbi:MAG: hypothetical protein ACK5TQ_20525, partial [Acetobacteraceae bacterium]